MTSFLSSIAASGGLPGAHRTPGAGAGGAPAPCAPAGAAGGRGAGGPASGYSSEGSAADFAGKERRLEGGSAFDGWSEAEDLALLVGEEPAPAGAADRDAPPQLAAEARRAPPAAQHQQQQQHPPRALRVSMGVQTAPAAQEQAGVHDAAAAAGSPGSPDSFVLADSPALFDEVAAAAEYESVPRQRSSGTQTQPHMLASQPLRSASAAGSARGASGGAQHTRRVVGSAAEGGVAAVGVGAGLAELQAAFGAGAKPALHTRLGGRHPFGPSHLYAYRGVVFEVLHNGRIATVTLFAA